MNVVIEIVNENKKPLHMSIDDARMLLGTTAVDEALALHVASRAELSAVHQELGEKVQELILAQEREKRLRAALERAATRLRTLNRDVFDARGFTDRYGDGDANRGVIAFCEEVLK